MSLRGRAIGLARSRLRSLPAGTRELALSLAGRGPGPQLLPALPPAPVLVVAPHPDDEVIGPGATLARHADTGHEIRVLVVTSGGATAAGGADVTATREEESRRALERLGVPGEPVFGRLPDGGLTEVVDEVARLVAEHAVGARSIYVPSLLDPHPDHRATAIAVAQAGLPDDVEVYGYEVWAAGPVDVLVDVTHTFARKQAALAEYHTALRTVDYVRSASGLAAYRSASGSLGGKGFAEGFLRLTMSDYRRTAAPMARWPR